MVLRATRCVQNSKQAAAGLVLPPQACIVMAAFALAAPRNCLRAVAQPLLLRLVTPMQTLSACGDAIRLELATGPQPGSDASTVLDNTIWFSNITDSQVGEWRELQS